MEFNGELLKKLTDAFAPSGNEKQIRDLIEAEIKEYADEIEVDALGNLIARIKGDGKKIMMAGHMDQIGLMVTDIDKKGFVRFTNIGGVWPAVAHNTRFIFENGTVGMVYTEPMEDKNKEKLYNMYMDVGASSKEEAEKLVSVGDMCVYDSVYYEDDNRVIARALDDRIGCYILIEAMKKIKNPKNDLYFVFTVQEEVGIRGAKTAAYKIDPDFGIAVDITLSGDTPEAHRMAVSLGKGAAIKVRDGSIVVDPRVKNMMKKVAEENKIPYQMELLEGGGTDSGAIHLTKSGVLSGVISVPTRYIHTANEMLTKADVDSCIKLLTEIVKNPIEL